MSRKTLILSLTLSAAIALTFATSPRLRFRTQILAWKLTGSLPDVPFSEIAAIGFPSSIRSRFEFEALSVEPKQESPDFVLWQTQRGPFWGRPTDRFALQVALRYRIYDDIYLRGPVAIRRGDVVLDAGSHLGTFTRYALEHGAGLVVAFEPDPVNNACFKRTFATEIREGRVILVEAALWHERAILRFAESPNSAAGSIASAHQDPAPTHEIEVAATTMDEAVAELKLERVDFIKLNVEGSERNSLSGGWRTLMRFHPRLVVNVEHRPDDLEVIPRLLRDNWPAYRIRARGTEQAYFY